MNKKLLTIFLSLFLVGILSVSCSSKQDPKGIEQYKGNTYVSKDLGGGYYLWISVQNGEVAIDASNNNTTEPQYRGIFSVTGSGTNYKFASEDGSIAGNLNFSSDGSSVTVRFTKHPDPSSLNIDAVCNIKK